ncbi:nucleotide exchange factor GrpE [[Clostridium] cellulosi]
MKTERGMTVKKNQNKDNMEQTAGNSKKTAKAEEKEKIDSNKSEAEAKAEKEKAETQEKQETKEKSEAQEKPEEKDKKNDGDDKDKPSDIDLLKAYLGQTLEELQRLKEENNKLKEENENLNERISLCKDKFERLVAEYENFRRRTAVEKENISLDVKSKVVLALLPVLDNLERAMPFAGTNSESFEKGVEMTLRQFYDAFKSLGVEEIEAQNAVFNPEYHEAVMHVEDENLGEGIITEVFQKGYKIGDKVVRHSVVKVAN